MFTESYERKLKGNNLILSECEPIMERSGFEERMITENGIRGFLPCKLRNEDGVDKFVYDITSKQSLKQIFEEREIKEADLRKIITGLMNIRYEIENYFLSDDNIILNPTFLYMDPETRIPSFVFYPYYHMNLQESLMQLAVFLLERTDHTDEGAVFLAYGFYKNVLNDEYAFDKLLLTRHSEAEHGHNMPRNDSGKSYSNQGREEQEKVKSMQEAYAGNRHPAENSREDTGKGEKAAFIISLLILLALGVLIGVDKYFGGILSDSVNERYIIALFALSGAIAIFVPSVIIIGHIRRENQRKRYDEIAREVYSEEEKLSRRANRINRMRPRIGNTEELVEEDYIPRRLVSYEQDGITEFKISKSPFYIGKNDDEADGVLVNPKASRIHAKIENRNGEYYITDQNSTNGTAVNGHILTANESVKLCVNDEVSFAGKVFYFR